MPVAVPIGLGVAASVAGGLGAIGVLGATTAAGIAAGLGAASGVSSLVSVATNKPTIPDFLGSPNPSSSLTEQMTNQIGQKLAKEMHGPTDFGSKAVASYNFSPINYISTPGTERRFSERHLYL